VFPTNLDGGRFRAQLSGNLQLKNHFLGTGQDSHRALADLVYWTLSTQVDEIATGEPASDALRPSVED
jgi:hypothetical protein